MHTSRQNIKAILTEKKKGSFQFEQNFDTADDFITFLETTLIPDLKDSGKTETANDFEKGVELLKNNKTDEEFVTFLQDTLIPDLIDSGTEATANDFEELIYWMGKADSTKQDVEAGSEVEEPEDTSSQSSLQSKIDDFLAHYEGAIEVDEAGAEVFKKAKASDNLLTALQLFNDAGFDDFDEFLLGNIE